MLIDPTRISPEQSLLIVLPDRHEGLGEKTLAWEMALFRRTRLSTYDKCLRLFDAYADQAPLWERTLLSAYVGIGPPIARLLGGNTTTVWEQAERIIADIFSVTGMSPDNIVRALRHYMKLKRETDRHLPFDQACKQIYDQDFYPLVTHFTFAFQSSAVARMRFIKRTVEGMTFERGTVVDIGCGSGAMLSEVLRSKPGWNGFGIDISRAAISYSRKLAELKGVSDRSTFQTADITDLPFRNSSVDLLIASEVIEHLPEPQAALSEIARVLVPGGFLALTIPIESHTPAHINTLSDADELRLLCREAGLQLNSLSPRWHLTFGDDSRHLFAVAQAVASYEPVTEPVYSLQISSAASSGMVNSW
jgi:ubiquinone/menaquinone biosynthesis C-methylase UbiE